MADDAAFAGGFLEFFAHEIGACVVPHAVGRADENEYPELDNGLPYAASALVWQKLGYLKVRFAVDDRYCCLSGKVEHINGDLGVERDSVVRYAGCEDPRS